MIKVERTKYKEASSKDPSVLCIDDEPGVLSALERTLAGEPYGVLRARDGFEALDLLERFPIRVVVSDQRMPGMSGSELLAEVRSRWPSVGCVILTAFPGPEVMIRGLQVGVDFLLPKPWDGQRLRQIIRCLMLGVECSGSTDEDDWCDLGGEGG